MHSIDLILTLTGGLGAALLLGFLTHRLKLSPIVGYLLAGVVVGPYTPGYIANKALADQLAEVGVILLMFGVGLQFHLRELLAVRRVALPGAIGQIAAATAIGALAMHGFGWTWTAGIIFGLAISVASTVVLVRVLSDNRELHTPTGHIAVGWLVVEDIFTVLVLVVLPAVVGASGQHTQIFTSVAFALLKLGALIAFTFLFGDRLLPKLLGYVVETRSRELFTLAVLVLALGIAVGSAELFGASMALGAFLAGIVVGRSDFALRAASEALPMRDAFAVLFFVSVGMLFEPRFLLEKPALVAVTTAIILLVKPLAAVAIVWLLRYRWHVALSVGVALAQIGEFSFILASLGRKLELLPHEATSALVAASILSITLNPILYRMVPRLARFLALETESTPPTDSTPILRHRAVVVGYGPMGQSVCRLLEEAGIEPTIVELNVDTVRQLRERGKKAIYGDAGRREVLEEAGIVQATALVLSAPVEHGNLDLVRLARQLNPRLSVVARCSYAAEVEALRKAGAEGAFSSEGEVALAMILFILRRLGATPDQVDRERDRLDADLRGQRSLEEAG